MNESNMLQTTTKHLFLATLIELSGWGRGLLENEIMKNEKKS